MWSTHNAMVTVKKHELGIVRSNLENARRNLIEHVSHDPENGIEGMYFAVATWGMYEKQVQETREWPYNAGIIRRLTITILSPAIVYLIKIFFGSRLVI